jgi:hypothetical protein
MNELRMLKELALADSRRRHPTLPDYARSVKTYRDSTANGLTKCIIDYLRFQGWQAERVNCTGRPQDNTSIVTDVLDRTYKIGSIKWLPTSGQRGTADISATIRGRAVKIEVKMKDRQSWAQKEYQAAIEMAGGEYWIVRSFKEFWEKYNYFMMPA